MEMNQELFNNAAAATTARSEYEGHMNNVAKVLDEMLNIIQSAGIVIMLDGDPSDTCKKQVIFNSEENCISIIG